MSKFTDWFPPSVRPARPGVYEVDLWCLQPYFEYWDGYQWFHGDITPRLAERRYLNEQRPVGRPLHWRGLRQEAK